MKICSRCVLPETFPGISFDKYGVCNYCSDSKAVEDYSAQKKEIYGKFTELLDNIRGKYSYDCTVAYSGGKDSTFALYLAKTHFKLNPLALTFDNGFISEEAFRNIRTVTEALGVDSLIIKADFGVMRNVIKRSLKEPIFPLKALERASTICTSCIGLAKFIFLKTALEKKIPLMVWGWTPGQAPVRSSLMKINASLFKSTQSIFRKQLEEASGSDLSRYFIEDSVFDSPEAFPYTVSPFAFTDYNEKSIISKIKKLGWREPGEMDANSTNCLLNSFANKVHLDRHGFHPYAFEIAGMVRLGIMSRKEGLSKLGKFENKKAMAIVKKKLASR
ncbi:MAG TPA: hypothetical protein DEE98_01880 [Elusimicrobia bacterium]|nr:MAG: hypothetical protein A2278_05680 [Elusimicrobia bacterium RIFOXYA12_FULL_49_49]OGS09608.1 MAG: hypothetical protein A2204_00885 [Elusimicrobia bacterium RIFOXYA1_FULL_47_7]OGS11359.1 MAG: hypothetical protein A2386_07780 [Elusimicrobia bacterium RIFOXYB1_FULL_48_9]OGS15398.1 MAG: hypothetical protein A2251_07510 [Elusimicrobia bacterium RIFOXYA2_FULL_47_53]OGS26262.1 MAG: hypothetical protein A2339_01550 [Elusimicrobia bacterium RIFOXYB12_FULL_50_12]OGS30826.1 MAG: hypothetical protein